MRYAFEKLYADLVTAEGAVCITYLTRVRLLGADRLDGGVELYSPDGRRRLFHCRPDAAPAFEERDGLLEVRLPLLEGDYVLRQRIVQGAWAPPDQAVDGLHWSVKVARAEAQAKFPVGAGVGTVRGTGYADWVCLTRFTRLLRFRRLRWGRVHLPDGTLVFNDLARAGGGWRPACHWPLGTSQPEPVHAALALFRGAGRVAYRGRGADAVDLIPDRVLHQGSAFDPERIPGRFERAVCWAIGGPTQEIRWVCRAGQGGWALHEHVRFGPLARRWA